MAWHIPLYQGLAQTAISSCLLLAIASLSVLVFREPARRVRIIEWTLAGLLMVPLLAWIPGLPRWSVLPVMETTAVLSNVDAPATTSTKTRAIAQPTGAAAPADKSINDQPTRLSSPRGTGDANPSPLSTASARTALPGRSAVNRVKERVAPPMDYRFLIVLAYFVGAAVMVGWSFVGLIALVRLRRVSEPVNETCRNALRDIAGPQGERVALLSSARVSQPCAFAWRPSTILMPRVLCESGDTQTLRWALAHEWSHVARGDVYWWAASGLVRCLLFYQPLLWWLRRQLQLSQDFVADAAAARTGSAPEDYAEFLTLNASRFTPLAAGLGIGGRTSDLHRRIIMLVDDRRVLEQVSPRRWNLALLPIAALTILAAASIGGTQAGATAQAQQTTDPKASDAVTAALLWLQKAQAQPGADAKDAAQAVKPTPSASSEKTSTDLTTQRGLASKVDTTLAGPRRIKPGDVLIVDAIGAENGPVLLRPRVECSVDANGDMSLGSAYAGVAVGGRTLNAAEGLVSRVLLNRAEANLRLNVRIEFKDPPIVQTASTPSAPTVSPYVDLLQVGLLPNADTSGTIVPGDVLNLEADGTPDTAPVRSTATVESDGSIALGVRYGRVNLLGKTLPQAEQIITVRLKETVAEPVVQVTFASRAASARSQTTPALYSRSTETRAVDPAAGLLEPLDTVDVFIAMNLNQVVSNRFPFQNSKISGIYLIEPDGEIALPYDYGRVQVKGFDMKQAGEAIRKRLTEKIETRAALPPVRVVKRGRAIFPEGKQPAPGYRIRPGDRLMVGHIPEQAVDYEVNPDGLFTWNPNNQFEPLKVEGLTLDEAHRALHNLKPQPPKGDAVRGWLSPHLYYLSLGGWREEADPKLIEALQTDEQSRMLRLERELEELKTTIKLSR